MDDMVLIMDVKPNFYKEFKCLEVNCNDICCKGWNVPLDELSINAMKIVCRTNDINFDDNIICKNGDIYINFKDGVCPFLKDKLCVLQRLGGDKSLCYVCREYPRQRVVYEGCWVKYSLLLSCEEAVKKLLIKTDGKDDFKLPNDLNSEVNSVVKYHNEIIDKIYENNNIKEVLWTEVKLRTEHFKNLSFEEFLISAIDVIHKIELTDKDLLSFIHNNVIFNEFGLSTIETKNLFAYYIWHYFNGNNINEVMRLSLYMVSLYDYFVSALEVKSVYNKADIIHRLYREIEHSDNNVTIINKFMELGE